MMKKYSVLNPQDDFKIGVAVQKIRKDKGIMAKDVYTGIVSRSCYFRFENGEHHTNIQNLMAFLTRMQVGINEFVSILFYKTSEHKRIIEDMNLDILSSRSNLQAIHVEAGAETACNEV